MSCHGKLQTLKNGTADSEIQLWAYQQIETIDYLYKTHDKDKAQLVAAEKLYLDSFERGKQIGYAEGMMNRSISVQNIEQFTEHEQENKMNTEPVAWMLTDRVVSSVPIEGAIPLYTHPEKTLNKEEILKLAEEFDIWLGYDEIKFIQFVLRKANEK